MVAGSAVDTKLHESLKTIHLTGSDLSGEVALFHAVLRSLDCRLSRSQGEPPQTVRAEVVTTLRNRSPGPAFGSPVPMVSSKEGNGLPSPLLLKPTASPKRSAAHVSDVSVSSNISNGLDSGGDFRLDGFVGRTDAEGGASSVSQVEIGRVKGIPRGGDGPDVGVQNKPLQLKCVSSHEGGKGKSRLASGVSRPREGTDNSSATKHSTPSARRAPTRTDGGGKIGGRPGASERVIATNRNHGDRVGERASPAASTPRRVRSNEGSKGGARTPVGGSGARPEGVSTPRQAAGSSNEAGTPRTPQRREPGRDGTTPVRLQPSSTLKRRTWASDQLARIEREELVELDCDGFMCKLDSELKQFEKKLATALKGNRSVVRVGLTGVPVCLKDGLGSSLEDRGLTSIMMDRMRLRQEDIPSACRILETNFSTLQHVSFTGNFELTAGGAEKIAASLLPLPELQTVDGMDIVGLGRVVDLSSEDGRIAAANVAAVSPVAISYLASCVTANSDLQSVRIGSSIDLVKFNDEGCAKSLFKALSESTSLTSIDLSESNLAPYENTIPGLLVCNCNVTSVSLRGCRMSENGITNLLSRLLTCRTSQLVSLDLAGNFVGPESIFALADILNSKHTKLQRVSVARTRAPLGYMDMQPLLRALRSNKSLVALTVSYFTAASSKPEPDVKTRQVSFWDSLGKYLAGNAYLRTLSVAGVPIVRESVLGSGIATNLGLTSLDLSSTSMSPAALEGLLAEVNKNVHLKSLDLSGNALAGSRSAVAALSRMTTCIPSLRALNLSGVGDWINGGLSVVLDGIKVVAELRVAECTFQKTDVEALAKFIATNRTCRVIDLSECCLSVAAIKEILGGLATNDTLQTLMLDGLSTSLVPGGLLHKEAVARRRLMNKAWPPDGRESFRKGAIEVAEALGTALEVNRGLRELSLMYFPWTVSGEAVKLVAMGLGAHEHADGGGLTGLNIGHPTFDRPRDGDVDKEQLELITRRLGSGAVVNSEGWNFSRSK